MPILRAGLLADLPALASLHMQCFAMAWDEEFLGRLLAQRDTFSILADVAGEPAGFALARAVAGEAEVLSLGVAPEVRRRGIGAALVQATAERAAQQGSVAIFLEVSVGNEAARALYTGLGFREVGRRPGYYPGSPPPAQDALVLRRDLPL